MSTLAKTFPGLCTVLKIDERTGVCLDGSKVDQYSFELNRRYCLKDYYVDPSTDSIIEHNLNWARGNTPRPIFQFAYLMLPTTCNQRCCGCFMGKDKGHFPGHLQGPFFTRDELIDVLSFLKEHGARAVVYGGGGELFTWEGAFGFIETIAGFGLRPVVFTNGTLLTKSDVTRLNSLGTALIISLRDTAEAYHNAIVDGHNFCDTLSTIDNAILEGFHRDGRLAVEIPVTRDNEDRVIEDFLPVMRFLGIVPMIEEYIQISTSVDEKALCHTFAQSRTFFERASRKDSELGMSWVPQFGQRIIAQPQCKRPLYSFAVFPNGDVMDCPSHSNRYGNFRHRPLKEIVYSSEFKRAILNFELCACSVFYTHCQNEIPKFLPAYMEAIG